MTITQSEMKELNNECCQTDCTNVATHFVYWPGENKKRMCIEHARKALEISMVLGFNLHVDEIYDDK